MTHFPVPEGDEIDPDLTGPTPVTREIQGNCTPESHELHALYAFFRTHPESSAPTPDLDKNQGPPSTRKRFLGHQVDLSDPVTDLTCQDPPTEPSQVQGRKGLMEIPGLTGGTIPLRHAP